MRLVIVAVVLAGFFWLIARAFRGAWREEQEWKANDAAWTAAHPETREANTAARRWFELFGVAAAIAVVAALVLLTRLNIVQACMIVAIPALLIRHVRQQRRERTDAPHQQN